MCSCERCLANLVRLVQLRSESIFCSKTIQCKLEKNLKIFIVLWRINNPDCFLICHKGNSTKKRSHDDPYEVDDTSFGRIMCSTLYVTECSHSVQRFHCACISLNLIQSPCNELRSLCTSSTNVHSASKFRQDGLQITSSH